MRPHRPRAALLGWVAAAGVARASEDSVTAPVAMEISDLLCPTKSLTARSELVTTRCCACNDPAISAPANCDCDVFPTTCSAGCASTFLTFYHECGAKLPSEQSAFAALAAQCTASAPAPPPQKHMWVEPPAATVIEDAPPCEPETLACTADSYCALFMHETLKGANMEDCEANAKCKAMIDCAMGLATGGLPPPPPPRRQKEPPGNNPCGVPVRSNTLCVCPALSR